MRLFIWTEMEPEAMALQGCEVRPHLHQATGDLVFLERLIQHLNTLHVSARQELQHDQSLGH